VRAVLPMQDLIDTTAAALRAFSRGQVLQPVREVIEPRSSDNFFAVMPAFIETAPAMGAKLVTVYHRNALRALPTHQAAIVLLDAGTGTLQAVMDGRYITEARTAAVSTAALRRMARPGARTLAILGSGVQAGSHLRAFSLVWEFESVRCWSPTAANLRKFVDAHPEVRPAASAEAAVRGADVVLVVTGSSTPVVWNEWVSAGACVIGVGACRPYQREMDPLLVARGTVIVDSRAAALKEAGDLVMAMAEGHFSPDRIAGELGEVLAGRVAGRTADDEITILKPLGQAVEDVAAAQLAYARAMAMGRGVPLD